MTETTDSNAPSARPFASPTPELESLLKLARQAAERAYCPYSNFHVGAALLDDQGRIFTGGNVENASYGLTICAERAAVFRAVAEGARRFRAVAVCCRDAPADAPPSGRSPCGACRQVLAEFCDPDTPILIDGVGVLTMSDLLPLGFAPRQLGKRGTG